MRGGRLDTEAGNGVGVGRRRPGGCSIAHACLLFRYDRRRTAAMSMMVDSGHIAINDKANLES
ncbi:hypothetical protein C6T65_01720 [Burkholderia vietnamiensis]|uniref:Uncharacterized protein n=1 Tax=Burkholderia vietnamiensis TaxID=60552 RepID=A0AA45BEU1_BURVI|nr:hypothetical protein C6T65_01720 [Burkholderia vietnamiensis]RQM51609.1 hypothetical protein EHZ18_29590 [Burkholderia vietnamiensis]